MRNSQLNKRNFLPSNIQLPAVVPSLSFCLRSGRSSSSSLLDWAECRQKKEGEDYRVDWPERRQKWERERAWRNSSSGLLRAAATYLIDLSADKRERERESVENSKIAAVVCWQASRSSSYKPPLSLPFGCALAGADLQFESALQESHFIFLAFC